MEHFIINGILFLAFANFRGDIKNQNTSSVIYKMDECTGKFILYQALQTRRARDLEYFSFDNEHFLAFANFRDNGTYLIESIIYKWNGLVFHVSQKILTKGASCLKFFRIYDEKYLAVANFHDGRTSSILSVIYKWKGGQFIKFQELATEGANGCTAFVISNNTFIAFANYHSSQQQFSVQSTVFKWSQGQFSKFQSLQSYGAQDVKSFHIKRHSFLVFANSFNGSNPIDSFIYKWDGSKFSLFQSVPTRGPLAWYPFVINCQTFLGVANYHGRNHKHNITSVIYQALGARFVSYQEIPTHGASDMTSFEYKGDTYLAVANNYDGQKFEINSVLYKWM